MKSILTALTILCCLTCALGQYPWQEPQAKVQPHGDLQWAPEPFEYQPGPDVRYIDYEAGNDNNDGLTKATAWKHHPWDYDAADKAAECSGPKTYVFKRGVFYRGVLKADESGQPDRPILLTSDPDWGKGEAMLVGSVRLPAEWVRAKTVDHPERMPEVEKVWALDLNPLDLVHEKSNGKKTLSYFLSDFWRERDRWGEKNPTYIGLFRLVPDGPAETLHIAQSPNWQRGNDNFVPSYWHAWQGQRDVKDPKTGKTLYSAIYHEMLQGHPDDYFVGGNLWTMYPWAMGTPTPKPIRLEEKKRGKVVKYYDSQSGTFNQGAMGGLRKNVRFKLDNLPQYLDHEDEFYLDPATGILFYRPAEGADPNEQVLELTRNSGAIDLYEVSHIEISGLRFSFTHDTAISISSRDEERINGSQDIRIHHCTFRDICKNGVVAALNSIRGGGYINNVRVTDCSFENIWDCAIRMSNGSGLRKDYGILDHVEVLRNRVHNTGMHHSGNIQSAVPAIRLDYPVTAHVAGNIVTRSFGSGIMIFGGRKGTGGPMVDIPFARVLVHHNKTEDTALGVNDYGGMSLWQGGPTYAYNNIVGNSPGHAPGGVFFGTNPTNLSYPLYLDGAFKQYCFNNIIWGRTTDPRDPYHNMNQAYFMVFGFLNDFVNNTVYNMGEAMGGSSGARQNIMGNNYAHITEMFMRHAHGALPSQIGGGDDNSSGVTGVATLGYARNVFHGPAVMGSLASEARGADKDIKADDWEEFRKQVLAYPIRIPTLGVRTEELPIARGVSGPIDELSDSKVDFRASGAAVDTGGTYFIPWSLYGCVGEWQFNKNLRDPNLVIDYHFYLSDAHINRGMYHMIPYYSLLLNKASLEDYVASPSEDWIEGALTFNGSRFGQVTDSSMRADIKIPLRERNRKKDTWRNFRFIPPTEGRKADDNSHWRVPEPDQRDAKGNPIYGRDQVMTFPASQRKTPAVDTQNLLLEANFRTRPGHTGGGLIGKFDGKAGYRLAVSAAGKAVFEIASGGTVSRVIGAEGINDGKWHHVLAEVDRKAGRMRIYVDGKLSNQAKTELASDASLDNPADLLVGKTHDGVFFVGAIDFMRICLGTLEDARTDIAELYEWQTNGPVKYDLTGQSPRGRRDAGALEAR